MYQAFKIVIQMDIKIPLKQELLYLVSFLQENQGQKVQVKIDTEDNFKVILSYRLSIKAWDKKCLSMSLNTNIN